MGGKGSGGRRKTEFSLVPAKGTKPFDRQDVDTSKSWEAFVIYRDLGAERTLAKVARQLGKSSTLIEKWSRTSFWRERVVAWDNEVDRQAREEEIKAVRKMRQQHLKIGATMWGLGMNELRKYLHQSKQVDENGKPVLHADQVMRLIEIGMKIERLNRGEPESIKEETIQVTADDKRRQLRQLMTNPAAAKALKQLAKAGKKTNGSTE